MASDVLAKRCNVQKATESWKKFSCMFKLLLQYYVALYLRKVYTKVKANYVAFIKSKIFIMWL